MNVVSYQCSVADETHLLGSAIAGDSASFHVLYQHYFAPLLARTMAELCDDNEDYGRDVLQQAFLDVYHNLNEIDRSVPFAESVMDAARDGMTSRAHEEKASHYDFQSLADTAIRRMQADDADPAEILLKRQSIQQGISGLEALFAVNNAANNKLASGIRYLFEVHHDGHSVADIAAREKKSVKAIEASIQNACKLLRPALAPLMG